MKILQVYFDDKQLAALEKEKEKTGASKAVIIRRAVDKYLGIKERVKA